MLYSRRAPLQPFKGIRRVLPSGVNCGVHLVDCTSSLKRQKKNWGKDKGKDIPDDFDGHAMTHKRIEFPVNFTWKDTCVLLCFGTGLFAIGMSLITVFTSFSDDSLNYWEDFLRVAEIVGGLALISSLSGLILKFGNLSKPRVWAVMNREDGQLWMYPRRASRAYKCSFKDYIGFVVSTPSQSGIANYDLWVSHKSERLFFNLGLSENSADGVCHRWEFLQAYMDKTQPLPDIPELEPYRKHDPVTVEWDKKNERPEFLYRNMPVKTYDKMRSLAWRYEKSFPLGRTRAQAVAQGWTPPPEKIWTLVPRLALTDERGLDARLSKAPARKKKAKPLNNRGGE